MKFPLPLAVLLPLLAPAQTLHQQGYWGRLYLRTHVSPRLTLHTEAEERRFINPDWQWQFITNHHLHFRASPVWDAALGLAFEEVSATLPLPHRFRVQTRLRVEQRWQGQWSAPTSPPSGPTPRATAAAFSWSGS